MVAFGQVVTLMDAGCSVLCIYSIIRAFVVADSWETGIKDYFLTTRPRNR
jgi:hypothetical protein